MRVGECVRVRVCARVCAVVFLQHDSDAQRLRPSAPRGGVSPSSACAAPSPLKPLHPHLIPTPPPQGFTDVQIKRIGPKWYRGVRRHGLIMGCSVTGVKAQARRASRAFGGELDPAGSEDAAGPAALDPC
jgi:hypothetical protein